MMSDSAEPRDAPPLAPKEDPGSLVLRGPPRPVVRFRRGLIVGVTGAAAAALVALGWSALEPGSFKAVADSPWGEPLGKAPPEALANAPASYGDVPRLGPPLPGDLGRPILEHRRSLEIQASDGPDAADPEAQRFAAAQQDARASAVLVQLAAGGGPAGAAQPNEAQQPAGDVGEPTTGPLAGSDAGQQQNIEFARSRPGDVNPHLIQPAPSPWVLSAGTIIPASLITGLNSDLPGMVIAQVTENVFDSATGRTVLVPQGARLVGSYDSLIAFGQRRALLACKRIIFPDGSSIRLDNMPATDLAGYAGLEDRVDFHTWQLLKAVALSTLLGVGTDLSLGGESDLVRAVRESTQQNAARAGDQATSRNLDVQPTLTVRPGWPLRAVIHKDLILKPWRG